MTRSRARLGRRLTALALTLGSVLSGARSSRADEPALSAHLECPHAAEPGRIVCALEVSAASGRLVWADALVVQAPAFARPLRSRASIPVAPSGATSAKLALVASEPGEGELLVLVRGVLCQPHSNGNFCAPSQVAVSAKVLVDAQGSPPP